MKKQRSSQRGASSPQPSQGLSQPTIDTENQSNGGSSPAMDRSDWDRFWFSNQGQPALSIARLGTLIVGMVYLALIAMQPGPWFGPEGWMNADLARKLAVATEGVWPARFRFTPLWLTSSAWAIQLWCVSGIICLALSLANVLPRITSWLSMLLVLLVAQRMTWGTGALEPLLVAMLGYVAIGSWHQTLSLRLVQVHLWLILTATLALELSRTIWWRGEAVWMLASTGHSNMLSQDFLLGKELQINALTHLIVIATLISIYGLFPFQLTTSSTRHRVGLVAASSVALSFIFVADQALYGCLMLVAASTFWPRTAYRVQ